MVSRVRGSCSVVCVPFESVLVVVVAEGEGGGGQLGEEARRD
jgi:hypothetical protein